MPSSRRCSSRNLRYSHANQDLLQECPIPNCERDFRRSRARTPTRGVDLPRYLNHLESSHHCLTQQADASWESLTRAIEQLPESYQPSTRNQVWLNKTAPTPEWGIEEKENQEIVNLYELPLESFWLKGWLLFSLGFQVGLFLLF